MYTIGVIAKKYVYKCSWIYMRSRCLRKYRSDARIVLLVAEYLHGAAAGLL